MVEKPKICKWCKWFIPSHVWDPRDGECKKPKGEGEFHAKEFKAGRYPAKLVKGDQDASKCPDFTPITGMKEQERVQV